MMLDLLTNTLAFVVALGLIIFVHEGGHLMMAKAFGMRVLTFSLGFGKRLWGFERGGTDYRVSALPLGGYVKLFGENPDESTGDPGEFLGRPRWQRAVVFFAGPLTNIVFSVALIAVLFMIGIEVPDLQSIPPVLGTVEAGSSAAAAGLKPGDRIVEVNGKPVARWQDVGFELMAAPDRPVVVRVERGKERFAATVTPGKVPRYEYGDTAGMFPIVLPRVAQVVAGGPAEKAGFQRGDELRAVDGKPITDAADFVAAIESRAGQETRVEVARGGRNQVITVVPAAEARAGGKGKIGVSIGVYQRYGPAEAVVQSVRYNWGIVTQTFAVIEKILSRQLAAKTALSGPIEIAAMSGAAARSGWKSLAFLMGFLSMSIAVLNLLPLPILDGGNIFILAIEGVLRRDLSLRVKERIAQVGFLLLVMLMVMVLYFDLVKTLPGLSGKP
ncbi:MAG: RIP metalloprotease RseP [Acidobacteriota bacterium]